MTIPTQSPALVLFPAEFLFALHRAVASDLPPADAARLLRQVGVECGDAIYDAFQERMLSPAADPEWADELDPTDFWSGLSAFFQQLGWGSLVQDRVHPGLISISSEDWVEAKGQGTGQPGCHFTTALLAELLGRVADRELAALEVECRATGAGCCRFLIGTEESLQSIYEEMRSGAGFPDAMEGLH